MGKKCIEWKASNVINVRKYKSYPSELKFNIDVVTPRISKKSRILIGVGTFATHMQVCLVYSVSILSCHCASAVRDIFMAY